MLMGVLQIQPGEAWLRRTSEPLAVFQFSSPCQTEVAASKLGKRHRITQRR